MRIVGFDRSKNFVLGAGGEVLTKDEILSRRNDVIAWSGVGHIDIFKHIKKHNLDYYYIDTGYFGNKKHKTYKRITLNSLNDVRPLIARPRDRIEKIDLQILKIKRGNKILLIPPDQKVLNCWADYHNADDWKQETLNRFKKFTDRPIEIRERSTSRAVRMKHDTFAHALHNDIYAVAVWSSNCAVESVLHSIPVINLGPTATCQVSPYSIVNADSIPNLDADLIEMWARHLSYCQFTETEMLSGLAWEYLKP